MKKLRKRIDVTNILEEPIDYSKVKFYENLNKLSGINTHV